MEASFGFCSDFFGCDVFKYEAYAGPGEKPGNDAADHQEREIGEDVWAPHYEDRDKYLPQVVEYSAEASGEPEILSAVDPYKEPHHQERGQGAGCAVEEIGDLPHE